MAGWDVACGFHQLALPLDRVHTVETLEEFHASLQTLAAATQLAISAQRDSTRGQAHKRISVLTICSLSDCYLFRIPILRKNLGAADWQTLAIRILTNNGILKLGYKLDGPIRMLSSTADGVEDILLNEPRPRIVDVCALESKMVKHRADIFRSRLPAGANFKPMTLSCLIEACLGQPLDLTELTSPWEQNILSDTQLECAALDAYCLLEVFKVLRGIAEDEKLQVAFERSVDIKKLLSGGRAESRHREPQKAAAGGPALLPNIPADVLSVAKGLQGLDLDTKVTVAALLIAQQNQAGRGQGQNVGKPQKGVCRYFNTPNGCSRRNCNFAHVKEDGIMEKRICAYFNTEKGCHRGNACSFAHVKDNTKQVCLYFSGPDGCRLGDKCQYQHIPDIRNVTPATASPVKAETNTAPQGRGARARTSRPKPSSEKRARNTSESSNPAASTSDTVEEDPFTGRLKAQLLTQAQKVHAPYGVSTYQLKLDLVTTTRGVTKKYQVGSPKPGSLEKVILVVGATGAGKTTLINSMVNNIMGVNFRDDFRFQLVNEDHSRANQAKSQTKHIAAYSLPHQDGFKVPFSLTIIDTPGFGDTEGIDRDKQITKELHDFFKATGDAGVDHIDAIGFVVQSALARLTPTQRYVFDSILSVFGKDIAENVCMLVTFADNDRPPVLAAVDEAKISYTKFYKFNNSAMFSNNKSDDIVTEKTWSMGMENYKTFFSDLLNLKPKSLTLTNSVMKERERLELCVVQIQQDIRLGLNKLEQLTHETDILRIHESDMNRNKTFTYVVEEDTVVKQDIPVGRHTTTCLVCNRTCHDNCSYADDAQKRHCVAMQADGTCCICPKKCVWNMHKNLPYLLVIERKSVTKTSQNLKSRYEVAAGKRLTAQQVVDAICDEVIEIRKNILRKTNDVRAILVRLQQIALKPNPLSELDYIDILIDSEKNEALPGWKKRVEQLLEVRKQAEYMQKISKPNYDPFKAYDQPKLRESIKKGKTECNIQ